MALPAYATPGQKVGYYSFLTYCGLVFFLLIAPNLYNSSIVIQRITIF